MMRVVHPSGSSAGVWRLQPNPVPGEQPPETSQLDRLLVAYHDLSDHHLPAHHAEPPVQDRKALYRSFQVRFPDLGLYPVCDPAQKPGVEPCMAGDAIDDLSDITLEMNEVIWLAENAGEAAAHQAYRSLYFHWGLHARDLASLLHARNFP